MLEKESCNIKKLKGNFLEQAIRVNHAGEYGAICIYSGQKFILKKSSIINEIIEMSKKKNIFIILMKKSKNKKFVPLLCCQFGVF